jgi:hypothetical protein
LQADSEVLTVAMIAGTCTHSGLPANPSDSRYGQEKPERAKPVARKGGLDCMATRTKRQDE